MKVGARIDSVLTVTRWVDGREIDTASLSGFENKTRWKLTEIDPQTTKISVQIDYNFPGGFAGKAPSKLFEPGVHAAVSASDHKLNSILRRCSPDPSAVSSTQRRSMLGCRNGADSARGPAS